MLHTNNFAVATCVLAQIGLLTAGCSASDDPKVTALIKAHLSPRAIHTAKDENGVERIWGIGLSDDRGSLVILPHLGKLDKLVSLHIAVSDLKDNDLKALPPLPKLREFWMGKNVVTDEGLKYLADMKDLRYLQIRGTQIQGSGLVHLAGLTKLDRLDLSENPLTDEAIPHIVNNFKRLRKINFGSTNVSSDGFMMLADLHWLTTIDFPDGIVNRNGNPKKERDEEIALMRKYVRLYKESKRKAREAGEVVPSDKVQPFGPIE